MSAKLYSWDEITLDKVGEFTRKVITGEKMTVVKLFINKGAKVPIHKHIHEQMSYVLKGSIKFFIKGEEMILKPENIVVIPSNVEHGAEALEDDTMLIEIFSPAREDFVKK
jgi:quercetin dioxygenase-like cupin family protein